MRTCQREPPARHQIKDLRFARHFDHDCTKRRAGERVTSRAQNICRINQAKQKKARRIKRSRYGRRAIEVLQPTRRVPVVGRIAAGRPIEAVETREEITLNEFVAPGRDYFALQVRGDSMVDDHILDGDHVIVERRTEARDGEVVVALLESGEATLKRIYREAGRIRLQPANAAMAPILVDRVDVQGVVVGVYRLL